VDLPRDGLGDRLAAFGLGLVDLFGVRRHLLDAAAVEDGAFGPVASRDPGRVHRDVAAADHRHALAHACVAALGHVIQHLEAGQDPVSSPLMSIW